MTEVSEFDLFIFKNMGMNEEFREKHNIRNAKDAIEYMEELEKRINEDFSKRSYCYIIA